MLGTKRLDRESNAGEKKKEKRRKGPTGGTRRRGREEKKIENENMYGRSLVRKTSKQTWPDHKTRRDGPSSSDQFLVSLALQRIPP